jgi:hypothetical protein
MRRKVEGKPRVEAFDPRRFEDGGDLIEGDFTVGAVDTRPTPSPVMQECGGDRRAPGEAMRERKIERGSRGR